MAACIEHPEFPQPEISDPALWRYMDASKFEWLLSTSRLMMPVAEKLGDHWEGTTPLGHSTWWQQLISQAESDEQRANLALSQTRMAGFTQQFRSNYYVSCWHRNEYENLGMWAAYTKGPESVAIKTHYKRLTEALPEYAYLGNVRYKDYSLAWEPSMNILEVIMHKDTIFSYEQETRAVVMPPMTNSEHFADFSKNLFRLDADPTFKCLALPISLPDLITDIVLHPAASKEFSEHIDALCKMHKLPAPKSSRRTQQLGS